MKMFLKSGLTLAVVAGVIATMAGPVGASVPSPAKTVERAEGAMGLHDDVITDPIDVVQPGSTVIVGNASEGVAVASGGSSARRSDSGVIYTVDRLDSDATRFAAILASRDADQASWDLGSNLVPTVLSDGRVSVTDPDGKFVAGVEAPWAVDAAGKRLATSYSVNGSVVTQQVKYDANTVFPVVADPKVVTFFLYYEVRLNHAESVTAVSTTAACSVLFSRSPVAAMKALSIGCGVFAAFGTPQVAGNHCLTVHVAGQPPILGTWWPTFPGC